MAQSQHLFKLIDSKKDASTIKTDNLFKLIDCEEEDASTIIHSALATVKADKSQENKKPPPKIETFTRRGYVHNSMMTKPNRHFLPYASRSQHSFTKEKSEGETHGNYRKQAENQHLVANGNVNDGAKSYNSFRNDTTNNGVTNGFQGNLRSNYRGGHGYQGYSRGGNRYNRNRRYNANWNNNGGVNGQKKETVVDADGFQVHVSRSHRRKGGITPDNQSQTSGESSFSGGDKRGSGYWANIGTEWIKMNNGGIEESSNDNVIQKEKLQPQNDGSETNGVEGKNLESSTETNTATEGDKEAKKPRKKKSGMDKQEGQDDSKMAKMKEDEQKKVFTLKEYEKAQLEKRKALDSIKQTEKRKVFLDKEFESMLLVDKRNNEDKQNSEKEAVSKKKEGIKGDKVGKVMSIDEFLKPANGNGEWRRRRRFNDKLNNGQETKRPDNTGNAADFATIIADANQFPALAAPYSKH